MIQKEYSFSAFGLGASIIKDLIVESPKVQPFIDGFFTLENAVKQTKKKSFSETDRKVLVQQLIEQNQAIQLTNLSKVNIENLKNDNAYTVTTGHQLNLFTGPLYSIYKVAQVIRITQALNERDKENIYVPVFWMATEDHDFEEINHFHLFNQKMEWEKEGQIDRITGTITTDKFEEFTASIAEKFREEEVKEQIRDFGAAYSKGGNLGNATRQIMNDLFGEYGLVIIDGNDAILKKSFAPIAEKEAASELVFKSVNETNQQLNAAGYHQQVYLRNCNLFYIGEGDQRERISLENGNFKIGEKEITKSKLFELIQENPEKISPNALLRPVYQEVVLPNIAYIGGGGEIAYWMQIKRVFDELNLPFPLLRVRDSLIQLRNREWSDLEELGFELPDLKNDLHDLVKTIALNEVEEEIELKKELVALNEIKNQIIDKAVKVNQGLKGMIEAEFSKMEKSIERIESKLIKAEKDKHEQKAKKIEKLQQKIYPNGGFQERYENFLPYYLNNPDFIKESIDNIGANDAPMVKVIVN